MRDVGLINGLHRLLIDAVRARVGRLEAGARNMRPRKKATLTPAASALIEEGDGQRNRRLASCSFRFPNRLSEKPADCAHECAQTCVPTMGSRRRYKALLWLHLASKATV